MENWVFIKFQSPKRHYIYLGFRAQGKKKKSKLYKEAQTSGARLRAEGEEREWASAGVVGSQEQSTEKNSFASSSLGISKLRSKPGLALSTLLWKASHLEAH